MWGMIALVLLGLFSGGMLISYDKGHAAGAAEVQQALDAANTKLSKTEQDLKDEAANHIADMATAFEVGESKAQTRTVYVKQKGAADVAKYPVFQNPVCTLPLESLQNLNAARGGFRHDAAPDLVRDNGGGASPGAGATPSAGQVPAAVRGAQAPQAGNTPGVVPADAGGRRPLGKVRP